MRHFLMCGLLFILAGTFSIASGQESKSEGNTAKSSEDAVERKYDRFKDETTVTLKPQRILDSKSPRQMLEITIQATFNGVRPKDLGDTIQITFTSAAEEQPDYDRGTLNFIVDGERVKGSDISILTPTTPRPPLAPDLKTSEDIFAVITFPALYQIANGRKVEMKLGPTEVALDSKFLENLRKFAATIFGK